MLDSVKDWICYTDRPNLQMPSKLTEIGTWVGPLKGLLDSEFKSIQQMAHFLTVYCWSQIMYNLDPSMARHLRQRNLTWNGDSSSSSSSNIPFSHFPRMLLRLVAVGFF